MNPLIHGPDGVGIRTITVREYENSEPVPLADEAAAVLAKVPSDRVDLRPTGRPGMYTIRATSWVGVARAPGLTIRIVPKVNDLRTVLTMFAAGSGIVDWGSDHVGYESSDLVDGVGELLLREIHSATRRGLVHGYRDTEQRLTTIRGRLDVQQLATRPWDVWPAPCRYDEFTADITENRVLLAAVREVRRWPLPPHMRRQASDLVARLADVSNETAPLMAAKGIRLSPVNEHYRAALGLSRLVLEGAGLAEGSGGVVAHTFLVDMNALFEAWIGHELTTRLWPGIEVAEQRATPLSRTRAVTMWPDLTFLRRGRVVGVADVKYKLTGSGLARTADYYQLLSYVTALGLDNGMLIYCRADGSPERSIDVVGGGQRLHTYPIDLGGSPVQLARSLDALAAAIGAMLAQQRRGIPHPRLAADGGVPSRGGDGWLGRM